MTVHGTMVRSDVWFLALLIRIIGSSLSSSSSSCIILHHLASFCIILHHLASSCIILHHLASSCTILHHLASSWIIFHHHFQMAAKKWPFPKRLCSARVHLKKSISIYLGHHQMQPMWLCFFSSKRFEETFKNAQWRKVK